jgi:hypothetical protein
LQATPSKSPGRQAIQRQSVVNLPPSLRRYSVYSNVPSTPREKTPYEDEVTGLVQDTCQSKRNAPSHTEANDVLHAADSDLSVYSSASARWDQNDDSFSSGAEALFRRFEDSVTSSSMPNASASGCVQDNQQQNSDAMAHGCALSSASTSVTSFYGEQTNDTTPRNEDPQSTDTLGQSLSFSATPTIPATSTSTSTVPGTIRADAIYDLYQVQRDYLYRIQTALALFITPLRSDGASAWLPGVPTDIGKLFTWFEDIVILHSHIVSALQTLLHNNDSSSECVGHVLREFVPRFEVYQPYLVRAPGILQSLHEILVTEGNDFTEYIRIQEDQDECQGSTLMDFMFGPLNHIKTCMNTFKVLISFLPYSYIWLYLHRRSYRQLQGTILTTWRPSL